MIKQLFGFSPLSVFSPQPEKLPGNFCGYLPRPWAERQACEAETMVS